MDALPVNWWVWLLAGLVLFALEAMTGGGIAFQCTEGGLSAHDRSPIQRLPEKITLVRFPPVSGEESYSGHRFLPLTTSRPRARSFGKNSGA